MDKRVTTLSRWTISKSAEFRSVFRDIHFWINYHFEKNSKNKANKQKKIFRKVVSQMLSLCSVVIISWLSLISYHLSLFVVSSREKKKLENKVGRLVMARLLRRKFTSPESLNSRSSKELVRLSFSSIVLVPIGPL